VSGVEHGRCWVAETLPGAGPCDPGVFGLQRAHLVRQQVIRREVGRGWSVAAADPRSWVVMCWGHHAQLDHSRKLKIPRGLLPWAVEEFAAEYGLSWWLDREYGERPPPAVPGDMEADRAADRYERWMRGNTP
jgi:hypothetical protein